VPSELAVQFLSELANGGGTFFFRVKETGAIEPLLVPYLANPFSTLARPTYSLNP
jgi:hypothetical protein